MLEGKSTAPGDALGCGVGHGAAPSPQFLPQADMWPLRALPCTKPAVPPRRVWPRQATEWQGSGSKAPPPLLNCGTKTERIQLWAVTKPNMTSSRPNDAVLKAKAAQHPKAEDDLTTTNANEVGAALAVLQAQFELNSIDLTWNSTNLTWKLPLCPKSKLGWYGLSKPGLCDVKCQPRPCCICM